MPGPIFIGFSPIPDSENSVNPSSLLAPLLREMTAKKMDETAALQRAELYYESHPRSPAAARAPRLFVRSGVWVALLGRSVRDGIAGFGPTIEAALRAFDAQYLRALRPAKERITFDRAA